MTSRTLVWLGEIAEICIIRTCDEAVSRLRSEVQQSAHLRAADDGADAFHVRETGQMSVGKEGG